MRTALLVLLVPLTASADVRLGVHAGGGLETGLIQGEPHPVTVGEAGIGIDYFVPGRRWGFGLVLERVGRRASEVPIGSEYKLDLLVRFADSKRRVRGGVGMGLRSLTIDGDGTRRPGSTLRGYDLLRMHLEVPATGALDFYFAWTFGLYLGEVYGERQGDMPYPMRDASTVSSAFVLGLKMAIDL